MSDQVSQQDVESLVQSISKMAPALDNYIRSMRNAQQQDQKDDKRRRDRAREFDNNLSEASDALRGFTGGTDRAVAHFTKSMMSAFGPKMFVGIAVFTALFKAGSDLNEKWREMTEVGQTFGGSMMSLQQAANAAGVPLDTFTKLQKQHNVTINSMGNNFWAVNKQLRQNIRSSGMYGMSIDQLGDFTSKYMEVARQNGALQSRSSTELSGDMQSLAVTTTALAKASDKTREQITQLATEAMSSALSLSALRTLPLEIRGNVSKSVAEATAGFAALPGKAGDYFAKFFNDTLGINASLTQGGQLAVEAGLSGLASQMDMVARKFKAGTGTMDDQMNVQNAFIDQVDANMRQLGIQAAAGNAAAAQMIEMRGAMEKTTKEEFERNKKTVENTKSLTALFASLEEIWNSLKGAFGNAFLKSFEKMAGNIKDLANSPAIQTVQHFLERMGDRLGTLLGTALSGDGINKLTTGIENVTMGFVGFFEAMADAQGIWTVLGTTIKIFVGGLGIVASLFDKLGPTLQKSIGVILGVTLAWKAARALFGQNMMVNARNVIVNEAGGGALGGAGKKGLRGMFGKGLKGGGKMLGRLAPFLGLGLEATDYLTGEKDVSWRNLAKSGLSLGGGAIGALGLGAVSGGFGSVAGGIGGYAAGSALGDMMFGGDTQAKMTAAATTTAEAATSIADTNAAMMAKTDVTPQGTYTGPVKDPMETLTDEIKLLRQTLQRGNAVTVAKLEQANRLLSKIEVSTQA